MGTESGMAGGGLGRDLTIRGRLLLLVAAMLVPYVLLVAFDTYVGRAQAIERALAEYESEARRIAAQLGGHIAQVQSLLAAVDTLVGEDLDASARNDDRLRRLAASASRAVSWISVIDADGRIISSSAVPLAQRATVNMKDRDYFRAAVQTRAFAISAPIVARTNGEWIVIMASPILDANQSVRAVAVAVIELDRFGELADSWRADESSQIAVSSDRGTVLLHAPRRAESLGVDASALPQFRVARAGGTFKGETDGLGGVRMLGASVPVGNAPWQLFYGVPYDTVLAVLNRRLLGNLAIAAAMLLIAVAAAWWIGRGLTLPIVYLRRSVNAIARGNLAHRVGVPVGGELGALVADVDRMAEKLAEAESRLRGLAALSSDFFWETDAEGRFTRLEGEIESALGVQPAAALGMRIWSLGLRVNGDVAAHRQILERRLAFRDAEFVRLDEDNKVILVLVVSGEPRLGPGAEFLGYRGVARDATERNRLEAAVRRAQSRLRLIVDAVPAIIAYVDRRRRFVFVNRKHAELFGRTPQETAGRTMREVLGDQLCAVLEPFVERALAGETLEFERPEVSDGGRGRDLHVHYVPDRDAAGVVQGFVVQIMDVSELRAAHRLLAASEVRFRSLFEVSQDGMVVHREGIVEQANSAMARLLGAPSPESIVGMRVEDLVTPEFRDSVRERAALLRQGDVVIPYMDRRLLRLDGSALEVEMGGASFMEEGERCLTIVVRDISARKIHEREIMELNAALERRVGERTAELTAAYREMESFSYSVAHDLRSPLGVISGFAHMVAMDEVERISDEGRRKLGVVESNVAHLVELVDDLLVLTQVNRAEVARAPLDMRSIAATALEELRPKYPKTEIRIDKLPGAEGDATLIRQAFSNLLDNALKYSSRTEAPRVEMGWSDAELAYYVRDNGAGFDMNHAARLFGAFERLHDAGEFPGTGIGLAIVKRVIERHGGRVWAESALGKGATFYFRLAG
jgi:PAS domain S-box-containing protein